MLRIDNTLLEEVGLGTLPDPEKNGFLKHIYDTLEMNVGIRLADQMSNEQLDEFEKYFEAKDDAGAFKWLETNFPNYKDIVQEEFDKLKAEVRQSAPQVLAAAAANPQPAAMPADSQAIALPGTDPMQPMPGAVPPSPPSDYQPQMPVAATPPAPPLPPMPPQQPPTNMPAQPMQQPMPPPPAQGYAPDPQPMEPPFPTIQPPAGPPQV